MKPRHCPSIALALLATHSVAHAQLIITEIKSDHASTGSDYWELTNTGAAAVSLGNFKWTDSARTLTGAVTIPAGTSIASGESIIFTAATPAAFRTLWNLGPSVQVVQGTAPGLGSGDAITLFNESGVEINYLSYGLNGFTRSSGSGAAGGHAGASAGGTATQALIWDPAFGTTSPRYTNATGSNLGTFATTTNPADIGSPGYSGFSLVGPSITLSLAITPTSFSESAVNPASTATVTRSGSTAADLVVTLSSSDVTEATVPATVTIPAGSASVAFPVTAVDDSFPDGSKTAIITASATDATNPTFTVTVQDDGDVVTTRLVLTEIQSNQSATAPSGAQDYWELTNFDTVAAPLAGYSWHDSGRSSASAHAWALPAGTMIAAGESVIFTSASPADFRAWWGIPASVQVFQATGSPGLGKNDGISFFEPGGNELFFFSYAAAGFTKSDGTASTGDHAGLSAGGSVESQALVIDPASGPSSLRYGAADGSNFGTFPAAIGTDLGSPGITVGRPTVNIGDSAIVEGNSGSQTMTLGVTRSDNSSAFMVDYAITGGTATEGTDYDALGSGTLMFTASGEYTLPISIQVRGDMESEDDETVIITLSNVVPITGDMVLGKSAGTGTILNDEAILPLITKQPESTTIAGGSATTLVVAASGNPAPSFQWYAGNSGDTGNPISGAISASFTTPMLNATASYWVRATSIAGVADSNTATVTVVEGATSVNLTNYVRVGRYSLPEPTRTARPAGTPSHNLLCQEASGVAYNWDTDTLFIVGDGGKSVTQVSKTGVLIDTMTLALGSGPQGTDFYDPEGITYVGGGEFVFTEERDRKLNKIIYAAGTTLSRSGAKTVTLGTFVDNTGTEGLSYDPLTGGFICLKEISPMGIFLTNVDFNAGTASNGSATTVNSIDLFSPSLTGMTDFADVFALSNLPEMSGQPQEGNLLVLSQEDAKVVNIDRNGNIHSTLTIKSDPGNPLTAGAQQHEGITMDRAGNIYVVNENGGGDIDHPELWVYAPSSVPNQAPTAVVVNNAFSPIPENSSTVSPVKVGDIAVSDDGLGTNQLSLSGADAASFEIVGTGLFLKAGTILDYETKTSYAVTISVDDTTVGTNPDATVAFTLLVADQVIETPAAPALIISEVAPWSSGNSPGVAADWFEVTNVSANPVNVTGWKVDDSSALFSSSLALNGITSIAPGESVIFIETNDPVGKAAAFKSTWFGASAPTGLQIGSYTGSGIGLSTGGDEVNLFDSSGALQARVSFGASPGSAPYGTFDNTVGLDHADLTLVSVLGKNGAFAAAANANEIGSPGFSAPGVLRVTEVAPWSSGNSPVGADWFEVTNIGARAVNVIGWKVDDSSESPAAAIALGGINSIAPGESVIYLETSTLASTKASFVNTWFGGNAPAGLQIGGYSGSGIGLSTGGDAVNLYDTNDVRRANVSFGVSPSSAPFRSFDNAAAVNVGGLTVMSAVGVNGALAAVGDANEIGSPGTTVNPPMAPTAFGRWLAANGYTSGGVNADSDSDGIPDGVEFFFNQSPNDGSATGNLPQVTNTDGILEFGFTHLTDVGGMRADLLVSGDLETWTPALPGIDHQEPTSVVNGAETSVSYGLSGTGPSAPGTAMTYPTPHLAPAVGASLGGIRVVNEGLVGAGRISGESVDSFGETQGAASGLAVTDWAWDGSRFSGSFQVLPDRGYNSGTIFSNYAARLHRVDFTFSPYYGAGPVAQTQIVPDYVSSTKFTYQDGGSMKFTTGLNAAANGSLFGQTVGVATAANGPGGNQESLLSFDAEGVHLFADGSGFVSDEYGAYIARFNADKQITHITQLPEAARPHRPASTLNFDAINAPTNGRRNNQGLEGLSVTPDGTRLFALLQSATVQDTSGSLQQTRIHARLFVYDIEGEKVESPELVGEYVVKLPQIDLDGNGSALDGTAAQSEIVAIGNSSFLMLPRDGNGMGKGTIVPTVFKAVQLVDFASATNIVGMYDGVGEKVSPDGVLRQGINAAATAEVINLLDPTQLAKFGFNTNTTPADTNTINEKIEGMALVPDLSTPQANDFFLFVANDNDFQSSKVKMLDATGNIVSYGDGRLNAGVTNDAIFYAYRITIDSGNRFYRLGISGE